MLCLVNLAVWSRNLNDLQNITTAAGGIRNVHIKENTLRISWTSHITNEKVLEQANTRRSLFQTVKQRKLSFFGHIMRQLTAYSWQRTAKSVRRHSGRAKRDHDCNEVTTSYNEPAWVSSNVRGWRKTEKRWRSMSKGSFASLDT